MRYFLIIMQLCIVVTCTNKNTSLVYYLSKTGIPLFYPRFTSRVYSGKFHMKVPDLSNSLGESFCSTTKLRRPLYTIIELC